MNIKKSILAQILGFMLLALTSAGAVAASEEPPVKSTTSGSISVVSADERKLGITVEYVGYPEVATMLSKELATKGYKVVTEPDKAALRLKVAPTYFGSAFWRPDFGESEKNPIRELNLGMLIPSFWTASTGAASNPGLYLAEVFGKFAGIDEMLGGSTWYTKGVFSRTKRPQQAFITSVELIRPEGKTEKAEILTETYAEGLPLEMVIGENLKIIVWFME